MFQNTKVFIVTSLKAKELQCYILHLSEGKFTHLGVIFPITKKQVN